jgi:hypothetical protein
VSNGEDEMRDKTFICNAIEKVINAAVVAAVEEKWM